MGTASSLSPLSQHCSLWWHSSPLEDQVTQYFLVLVVVLLLLLLLLLVVIPRLHCYVHPTSALVRRRSWHRKMKIPSTSLAWMVRPNPRKKQTKEKVQMMCLYINCVTYATNSNINMQVYMYIHTHTHNVYLSAAKDDVLSTLCTRFSVFLFVLNHLNYLNLVRSI